MTLAVSAVKNPVWIVLTLLLALGLGAPAWAQSTPPLVAPLDSAKAAEQQATRSQVLDRDRDSIRRSRATFEQQLVDLPQQLEALRPEQLDETLLEQTRVDVESARLSQDSNSSELANTGRRIDELQKSISDLETREQLLKNPVKGQTDGTADRVAQLQQVSTALMQQRAELALETRHLENLREQAEVVKLRLQVAEQWRQRVEQIFQQRQEQARQSSQSDLVDRLQADLSAQQDRASALRQRLAQPPGDLSLAAWQRMGADLRITEERISLLNLERHLGELGNELARLGDLLQESGVDPDTLHEALKRFDAMREDLQRNAELLQQRSAIYVQQRQVIERREPVAGNDRRQRNDELQQLNQLLDELGQRTGQVQDLQQQVSAIEARLEIYYQERLRQDLLTRKPYPDSVDAWQQLLRGLAIVPQVLLYQIRLSVEAAFKAMLEAPALRWVMLVSLQGALFWLLVLIGRGLRRVLQIQAESRNLADNSFLRQLFIGTLLLARVNLPSAGFAAALLLLLWLVEAPPPGLSILMTLALVWVGIRLPVSLAWLLLAAPRLPAGQQHLPLYRQLRWTLGLGGLLVALVVLAHLSDLPENVVTAFDRVFMLYWFWAFVPGARIRRLVVERIGAVYSDRFWFVLLRFGSLLLPLSLLGAAVLGLLGYLRLAWLVAGNLLIFLAVLVSWLLARSLLNDLVVALKNYAVTHSGYGLLWTQDIIAPLHRILNLLLYGGAWVVLFRAYGWTSQSAVIASVWGFLERPLFEVGNAGISPWRIALTVTVLVLVIWLGQWSRAITYRWILSRISDLGVRHSLSMFTQYAVVLIGLLTILRIIGIDLTTLAVFAGAVGVGIGLGMQSLANNFISGLFLLIERPLRSGDIVKIGPHEGEVASIGMRSLTVKTFDNQTVIIPNAAVISDAFTNWTHEDRVLRTVLIIGASYESNPHQVQKLLAEVLEAHPAILPKPEPLVLLWEFADSAVNFRLQYFVDMSRDSLFKTRAEVLMAIWDCFKAAGISIPYPQRDLYVRSWPGAVSDAPPTAPIAALAAAPAGRP